MKIEGKGKALAVLIGEADRWHGKSLYHQIVVKARQMGMAGATVTRGLMGFGANSRIHSASIVLLSEDLPIVVTIVDTEERIAAFLPVLDEMVGEGMVMTWDVNIEMYRHGETK